MDASRQRQSRERLSRLPANDGGLLETKATSQESASRGATCRPAAHGMSVRPRESKTTAQKKRKKRTAGNGRKHSRGGTHSMPIPSKTQTNVQESAFVDKVKEKCVVR